MKTPPISGKLLIRALELSGYVQKRVTEKHILFSGHKGGNYFVVQPNGDVPWMHINTILYMSGLSRSAFFNLVLQAKNDPSKTSTILSTIFSPKINGSNSNK